MNETIKLRLRSREPNWSVPWTSVQSDFFLKTEVSPLASRYKESKFKVLPLWIHFSQQQPHLSPIKDVTIQEFQT